MKTVFEKLKKISSDYRATVDELAAFGPGGYFGRSSAVGSAIMQGMIEKLPGKLDEMSERWSLLER